jgi:hypothetical protein
MRSFSRKEARSGGARRPLGPSMGMTATTGRPPLLRPERPGGGGGAHRAGGGDQATRAPAWPPRDRVGDGTDGLSGAAMGDAIWEGGAQRRAG